MTHNQTNIIEVFLRTSAGTLVVILNALLFKFYGIEDGK